AQSAHVNAYDSADGALKWSWAFPEAGGSAANPCVIEDGGQTYIYAHNGNEGKVYCLKDEGTSASLFWSFDAGSGAWGQGAVGSDGTYYVGDTGSDIIYALAPYDGTVVITTFELPDGAPGSAYYEQLGAWGGTEPYNWSLGGSLPTGLTLSAAGLISGTIDTGATGLYEFTVTVTDSEATPSSDTKAFSIYVIAPPPRLTGGYDTGKVDEYYEDGVEVIDGWPPFTFSYTGSLPPGLTMDPSTSVVSGTPTTLGVYTFSVTVTDNWEPGRSDSRGYGIIVVTDPPEVTDVARNSSGNIELTFTDGGTTISIISSIDPYDYNEGNMDWMTVEASGLTSGTWEDTTTPATGEKYYHIVPAGEMWSGSLIAYEGFDYEPGAFGGQNGGVGWADAWELVGTQGQENIVATGLGYSYMPVTGGALRATATADTPTMWWRRNLGRTIGETGTTLWVSYLYHAINRGDGDTFLHPRDAYQVMFGKRWGSMFSINNQGGYSPVVEGETYFLVARYDFNDGDDDVWMWVNPPLGVEPNTADADSQIHEASDMGQGTIVTQNVQGYGLNDVLLDEIRFGESWNSVIGMMPISFNKETYGMMTSNLITGRNMESTPFEPYPQGGGTPGSASLDKYVGTQLTGHPVNQWVSDRIEAWDANLQSYMAAWLKAGVGWKNWGSAVDPPVFSIDSDKGYWFNIKGTAKTFKHCGRVSKTNRSLAVVRNRNMQGSCFPVSVALEDAGLISSGFLGHPVNQWASDRLEFWYAAGQNYVGVWFRTGILLVTDNFEDNTDVRFTASACTLDFSLTNEMVIGTFTGAAYYTWGSLAAADPPKDPPAPWNFTSGKVTMDAKIVIDTLGGTRDINGQSVLLRMYTGTYDEVGGTWALEGWEDFNWVAQVGDNGVWKTLSYDQGTGVATDNAGAGYDPANFYRIGIRGNDPGFQAADEIHVRNFSVRGGAWRQWGSPILPPVAPYDKFDPCEGWWMNIKQLTTGFTWTYPKP
ncbi:MAG TPA: putative Ig domain-containing protein, partial [Dehalococcoidales bacterium]|nr:putative Ig domain-containing protein [Dehalococcoidales bacterium]